MKTIFIILLARGITFGADSIKVLTYNIQGMKPGTSPKVRIIHIIDKIIQLDPDIIGLQEINESLSGGGADNQAKVIADSLSAYFGINYNYYTSFTHLSWNNNFREFVGIITKYNVEEEGFFQLVAGVFPRKVVWNKIKTPLGTLNFFNTHLSFNSASVRTTQVGQIISYIQNTEANHPAIASILTGDFNDEPTATSIQLLTNTGSDTFYVDSYNYVNPGSSGFTMPSDVPNRRIDYVFTKSISSLVPFESDVVMNQPYSGNNYCSDHLGVLTLFNTGVLDIDEGNNIYPEELKLFQNYPNPFNPITKIKFSIPNVASGFSLSTTLKVYDILGEEVAKLVNEPQPACNYEISFDATSTVGGLSSGIYLFKIQVGDPSLSSPEGQAGQSFSAVKKMILLR
ncbi:MAG: endonuclease/exonuclease/phosphatase family protein [Candidatus Kariarchaeaceae archaeon]|jgi:endonuclease/exonuclease/phosphatase family metal-dependent hydrolase